MSKRQFVLLEYYCDKCGAWHKATSKIGKKHSPDDPLYDVLQSNSKNPIKEK